MSTFVNNEMSTKIYIVFVSKVELHQPSLDIELTEGVILRVHMVLLSVSFDHNLACTYDESGRSLGPCFRKLEHTLPIKSQPNNKNMTLYNNYHVMRV